MKRRLIAAALVVACAPLTENAPEVDIEGVDPPAIGDAGIAITNGVVYLATERGAFAEAVGIRGDSIVAVGTNTEVLEAMGPDAEQWDASGRTVVPGFHDLHLHVPEAGAYENFCYLPPERTGRVYANLIAACAAENPDGWVTAAGASLWNVDIEARSPLEMLDEAVPNRPVLVIDDLGHAAWTNSLGLAAAGITADSPDPQGGVFQRDSDGNLTGLLLEDAQQLVRNALPVSDATLDSALETSLQVLAANGVTTVSDSGGYYLQNHTQAWIRAADAGTLTVRAVNDLYVYPDLPFDEQMATLTGLYRNTAGERLRIQTAKIYADGILDLGSALLVDPYDSAPGPYERGFPYFQTDALNQYVNALHQAGFQIEFHAVGDGAVRISLDAVEAIEADPTEIAARHHRTTHNYLIHEDDVPRFAELGVVADFQFGEETNASYATFLEDFIGERAARLLPVADMVAAGGTVTLSSDWDADALIPTGIISRSVHRQLQGVADVESAVRMLTIVPAQVLGHDDLVGSIEVGKRADIVILSADIFDMRAQDIDNVLIDLTMIDGEAIYARTDF
ncbi:MAG: putative amidohydrolase YtcJ [Bradymonadia bacterium]|jgi:predicted amidohydrolase YtcJ